MMTILSFMGYVLLAACFILLVVAIILGTHYLFWFKFRSCKYCGHTMEYKGLRGEEGSGHYLFHCPKCGAWEQLSQEKFLKEIEKYNDNN